jgi:hypothetical protein
MQQPNAAGPVYNFPAPAVRNGPNGLGIAALVLGLVAFVLAFIPLLNLFGAFLAFVGLVLGVVALFLKGAKKGAAIAGSIVSGVALIISSFSRMFPLRVASTPDLSSSWMASSVMYRKCSLRGTLTNPSSLRSQPRAQSGAFGVQSISSETQSSSRLSEPALPLSRARMLLSRSTNAGRPT